MAESTSKSTRPTEASPWGSEESREFLQERISQFARIVFLVAFAFFLASWIIDLFWYRLILEHGLPIGPAHLFNLGWLGVFLTMWLATRGGSLPGSVPRRPRGAD